MAKFIFGLLFIAFGVVFLLNNFEIVNFEIGSIISTYWPLIIIILGIKETLEGLLKLGISLRKGKINFSKLFWGLFILGIGVIFQGNQLDYFHISVWNFIWPTLIIYLGLTIIFGSGNISFYYSDEDANQFRKTKLKKYDAKRNKRIVGELRIGDEVPWELENMQLWNGIGEVELNLYSAIIKEGEFFIDISGWVGEITVIVPQDLAIKVNADVHVGEVNVLNHKQSGTSRFVTYTSEGYDKAEKKVNLMVSLSIGEVNVKQVD